MNGEEEEEGVPYVIEHSSHHPLLGLPHSNVQAFGFALALCERGLAADSAVGVHDLDGLFGLAVLD